ncbi:MAG: hypothetical protein Kow0070_26420 [Anaerolineales bacterium]
MADSPTFDIQQAHKFFSADCFNKTWDNIEKDGSRSVEENMEMLHTAIASLWHWTQREDVQAENLSIGYWQVSRVYCLIRQPHNARRYGLLALQCARELSPFLRGYAYETLARAEMLANNRVAMKVYLEKAQEALEQIEDEEDRQLLARDLETIR